MAFDSRDTIMSKLPAVASRLERVIALIQHEALALTPELRALVLHYIDELADAAGTEDKVARATALLIRTRLGGDAIPSSYDGRDERCAVVRQTVPLAEGYVLQYGFRLAKSVLAHDAVIATLSWAAAIDMSELHVAVANLTADRLKFVDNAGGEMKAWVGLDAAYISRWMYNKLIGRIEDAVFALQLHANVSSYPKADGSTAMDAPNIISDGSVLEEWSRRAPCDLPDNFGAAVVAIARIQLFTMAHLVVRLVRQGVHYPPAGSQDPAAKPPWWDRIHETCSNGEQFDPGCIAERCWFGLRPCSTYQYEHAVDFWKEFQSAQRGPPPWPIPLVPVRTRWGAHTNAHGAVGVDMEAYSLYS